MSSRDIAKLPMSAWGRHELEAEVKRLQERVLELEQTGGPCSECAGSGRHSLALGACEICEGSGRRVKQVEGLLRVVARARVAYEEASRKADDHRRQRDAAQAELALRKPLPSKHRK